MEWTLFEVLGTLVLAVLLWKIVRHAWSVYFSPLAKLPGPRFALWFPTLSELPYYAAGKAYLRTWDLVRRFGRVVRVANDAIVVADPEAAKLILKTKDLPKSGIYSFLKSPGDVGSSVASESVFPGGLSFVVDPFLSSSTLLSDLHD